METQAAMERLLETVFSVRSMPKLSKWRPMGCKAVKYGHGSHGTQNQESLCWWGPEAIWQAGNIAVIYTLDISHEYETKESPLLEAATKLWLKGKGKAIPVTGRGGP
jgi:hypothetical protein